MYIKGNAKVICQKCGTFTIVFDQEIKRPCDCFGGSTDQYLTIIGLNPFKKAMVYITTISNSIFADSLRERLCCDFLTNF